MSTGVWVLIGLVRGRKGGVWKIEGVVKEGKRRVKGGSKEGQRRVKGGDELTMKGVLCERKEE